MIETSLSLSLSLRQMQKKLSFVNVSQTMQKKQIKTINLVLVKN